MKIDGQRVGDPVAYAYLASHSDAMVRNAALVLAYQEGPTVVDLVRQLIEARSAYDAAWIAAAETPTHPSVVATYRRMSEARSALVRGMR